MEEVIQEYAPVVIPTLCRFEHFKRCIESLSNCTGAERTVVYVGLDYPAKESHWDGYNKIKDYLESCGNLGFKELIVIRREKNYGCGQNGNYATLRNMIFEKYDRYISTEDDNEFSPCFLDYMNKGLEMFKDDDKVFSIDGYHYTEKINKYPYGYYIYYGVCAWGIGFWKNKYEQYLDFYEKNPPRDIILSRNVFKIIKANKRLLLSLLIMNRKRVSWGDCKQGIYCLLTNRINIFPIISKVRNFGVDGSGATCADIDDTYSKVAMDKSADFIYDDSELVFAKEREVRRALNSSSKTITFKEYLKLCFNLICFVLLLFIDFFDKKGNILSNSQYVYLFCIFYIYIY